mgnify:CR=1 FL=1
MSEDVENAPRYQVRFHSRGGQGAVTAAQICMIAFPGKGTAFPRFGAERMGAPVASFVKMSKDYNKVRTNEQVYSPQYVCVLDDTLLNDVDCTEGMVPGGYLVVNTKKSLEEIQKIISKNNPPEINIALVDATEIALEQLGRNITNTIILGALLKVAPQLFSLDELKDAIAKQFREKKKKKNMDAVEIAPTKTDVHMLTDVELSFEKDYKEQWSHIGLGKKGAKELDKAGVWYTSDIDGGSANVNTGSWGVSVAVWDEEKCIQCSQCWPMCPDFATKRKDAGERMEVTGVDAFHCKGCGICVEICPKEALTLKKKK